MQKPKFTIDKIREIEERGRDLAKELVDEKFSTELGKRINLWEQDIKEASVSMVETMKNKVTYDECKTYVNFITNFHPLRDTLYSALDGCIREPHFVEGAPRLGRGHIIDNKCYVDDVDLSTKMSNINKPSEEMTGSPCATFYKKGQPYPLSMLVNDMTQCYHGLLREYDEFRDVKRKSIGKCVIETEVKRQERPPYYITEETEADKDMVDACKEWDETTDKFNKNNLYLTDDNASLNTICWDKKCEFTVGDSPGHRTHLDLDKGTVDYYDDDYDVNEGMYKLFNSVGLKCKVRNEGVSCERLNRKNVKEVAKRLAGATSMDIRLISREDQEDFWGTFNEKMPSKVRLCRLESTRKIGEGEDAFIDFDMINFEKCLIEEKIKAKEW